MSFSDFFQNNIIWFAALIAIFGYLMFLEVNGAKMREIILGTSQFIQKTNQGAVLIDLRSADDFRKGHIAGARHIEKKDLANHFHGLPKDKTIAFYCYSGNFSNRAITEMKKAGFSNLVFLDGGMNEWQKENLPTNKV